jgi:hypothetical protein
MPKRRHILILFACGAMVVIALAFLAAPHEPSYKGKSLSQWLESYDPEDLTASAPATEAIHHIGTNALPYIEPVPEAGTPVFMRLSSPSDGKQNPGILAG